MSEITIVIDGEDKASSELDQVSSRLQGLQQEGEGTNTTMAAVGNTSQDTGNKFTAMAGKLKGVAVGLGALMVAKKVFDTIAASVTALNDDLGRFEEQVVRLEHLTGVMASTSAEAEESFEAMGQAVSDMSARTGQSINELNSVMSELVLRFGDNDAAAANFERTLNLMALTGMGASQAARAITDAQQGHFRLLRRSGGLTREQIEHLEGMKDETEAAALAIELLDHNLDGYIDKTPLAIEASDRLSTSFERMRVAAAQFSGVDRIMDRVANGMERVANATDTFVDGSFLGLRSITEEMERLDRVVTSTRGNLEGLREGPSEELQFRRRLQHQTREYDLQIERLRILQEERGNLVFIEGRGVDVAREIARLEQERARVVETLEASHLRRQEHVEEETQFHIQNLRLQQRAVDAADQEQAILLEQQATVRELTRERNIAINALIDENGFLTDQYEAQRIEQEFMLELSRLQRRDQERIASLNRNVVTPALEERSRLQTLAIEMRSEALVTENQLLAANLEFQARLAEIEDEKLDSVERRFETLRAEADFQRRLQTILDEDIRTTSRRVEETIQRANEGLREAQRLASRGLRLEGPAGMRATSIIAQDAARDAEIIARHYQTIEDATLRLGQTQRDVATMVGERGREQSEALQEQISLLEEQRRVSEEAGLDTTFMDRRIEALREENQLLLENNRLQQERWQALGATADQLASMTFHLSDLAAAEWDFEEASRSVVAAQQALSGAVSMALDAAGMGIQERAKWMAVFEGAQAVAATGMALMFPSPNYWAAAANHAIAATQFGLIAGGVIGGTQAAGAGGSVAQMATQRDSILDEAMRLTSDLDGGGGGGDTNIYIDFGQRNAYLQDSRSVSRDIVDGIEEELLDLVGT